MQEKNYIVFVVVASTVVALLLLAVVADLFLVARKRRLRHQNELLDIKARFEGELLRTRHEATEQVFNDIAAELHDNIGQTLTLAIIQLNRMELTTETSLRQHMEETRDIIRQAIGDVRSLSHEISSDYWRHFDLKVSLSRLRERLLRSGAVTPDFLIAPDLVLASKDHEVVILRILQELVNNSLKHSGAGRVSLHVHPGQGHVMVSYADDGKGIDIQAPRQEGMGLSLVKQRLDLLNAQWEIKSKPGEGFNLEARIPLT